MPEWLDNDWHKKEASFDTKEWGGYISFSDPFQISNPSQLFCNSSTLLKSFSKRKTFSKPSHYIQGGPSQSEYLLRSISNGVYVLLLKAILDFNTEKPSQIHLKSLSSDNLLKTISTHDHRVHPIIPGKLHELAHLLTLIFFFFCFLLTDI